MTPEEIEREAAERASTLAGRLAARLADVGAGSIRAILLYGSHLLRTNPNKHSAIDFVVLVDDYHDFFEALNAAGHSRRPPRLLAAVSEVLAPSVIAFMPQGPNAGLAKCLIVSSRHFEEALGANPPDHFLLGRLVQRVAVVYGRSEADEAWAEGVLLGAHSRVLQWMAPFLEGPVDAAGLGRRLLEVCYGGELRPESKDRANSVFKAQRKHFREVLGPVLAHAAACGDMIEEDGLYRLASPVKPVVRKRWQRHFRRSKIRATLRWFKHMLTFDNWLPYVQRKVERHTGRTIRLTWPERVMPLLFLWPRAIAVLLTRPKREVPR